MATLYALAKEMTELESQLDEILANETEENLLTPERLADEIKDRLGKVELDFEHKVKNIIRWIRNLQASNDSIDSERKRLAKIKTTNENTIESLRNWLLYNMQVLGMKRFDAEIAKLTVTEPRESMEVDESEAWHWPEDVFNACCTQKVTVNKTTLKQKFGNLVGKLKGVRMVKGEPGLMMR